MTTIRWKLLAIVVVVGLAVWSFTPPSERVRLGLDLKGGVHLVLQVQTDDAVRIHTETTMEQMVEELRNRDVAGLKGAVNSPTEFGIEGVPA